MITLCDTGRQFGGKQCAKKVRDVVKIMIEDKMMVDGVLTAGISWDDPLTAMLCGLHSKKYSDRCRDLGCTLPDCWGRGFTCEYGERSFKYCHVHMAAALEEEVKLRHNLTIKETAEETYVEWEDEGLWQKKHTPQGTMSDMQQPMPKLARVSADSRLSGEDEPKKRLSEVFKRSSETKEAEAENERETDSKVAKLRIEKNETSMEWEPSASIDLEPKAGFSRQGSSSVDPDRVFGRYAQHGNEVDTSRAADIESLMPSFVRRPREKPTFIPVEMQLEYENRSKKKEPWEVVAEGIGEIRQGADDKDSQVSSRLIEFTVFALRGFGCFKVELGTGAFGKDLTDILKRQATSMKELMYRRGIRVPLTNRIIKGITEATWGSEVPGGQPDGSLMASDFTPWDLNGFEDYVRKDDKVESRQKTTMAMSAIAKAIKQQIKIFGAVYGEEHVAERLEALSFLEDLNERYEEFFSATFLLAVWDEMCFEYNMVIAEGVRRILQALPKGVRRDKLKEMALLPRQDGSATWKFPVTFKMTNPLGFWKSRIVPRLERKVERDMLHAAIPSGHGRRAAGMVEEDSGTNMDEGKPANHYRSMYPAGRRLTVQEQRESRPFAPQTNGADLCWDFSSWSGCPKGKECNRVHQTTKLQGLHWLILAQLARRGGHVSRSRIEPDAVDGYIQALRESNAKYDSGAGKGMWQPKGINSAAGETRRVNPAVGMPPGEFLEVDLTALERELEEALYANDEWIFEEHKATVDWKKADSLTRSQREVQDWWDACALPVHGALDSHVLNDLLTVGKPFGIEIVERTLNMLLEQGSEKEKALAGQALVDFKAVRAGKQCVDGVIWGVRREWGSFTGQEMQIGNLHFEVVDLGENILLNADVQRVTGQVEKREQNQCILLHLAAALV